MIVGTLLQIRSKGKWLIKAMEAGSARLADLAITIDTASCDERKPGAPQCPEGRLRHRCGLQPYQPLAAVEHARWVIEFVRRSVHVVQSRFDKGGTSTMRRSRCTSGGSSAVLLADKQKAPK